jgi:hypothetical protein
VHRVYSFNTRLMREIDCKNAFLIYLTQNWVVIKVRNRLTERDPSTSNCVEIYSFYVFIMQKLLTEVVHRGVLFEFYLDLIY